MTFETSWRRFRIILSFALCVGMLTAGPAVNAQRRRDGAKTPATVRDTNTRPLGGDAAEAAVQLSNCPDVDGLVSGTGRLATTETKQTAPPQTAATERKLTAEFKITGHVNDAAELTHFDMTGVMTETMSGPDLALNAGSPANAKLRNDVSRVAITVEESTAGPGGAQDGAGGNEIERQGRTMISVSPEADAATAARLTEAAGVAVKAIFEEAAKKFRLAREQWRGGACVEVKLSAPKTRLLPGEKIVVVAEGRQKQEKAAINSLLVRKEATAAAAPNDQRGAPQARFTLTAPPRGEKAMILIESVSKRGIGSGKLEFEETVAIGTGPKRPTKPPAGPPKRTGGCTSGWSGTISVITGGRRDNTSENKIGGRLKEAISYTETSYKIDLRLSGERDSSGGFVNAHFADARVEYLERYFRSFHYVPGNYCGGKPTASLTKQYENKSEATGSGRVTVFVSAYTRESSFQLAAPKAIGVSTRRQAFESGCAQEDKANTSSDPQESFEWQFGGILFEFQNDTADPNRLTGSKKVQNGDGTETTVIWELTRNCK